VKVKAFRIITVLAIVSLGCCPGAASSSGSDGYYSKGLKKFDEVPLSALRVVDAKPSGMTHLGSVVYNRSTVEASDKAAWSEDYVKRIAARHGADTIVFTTKLVRPDGSVRYVAEIYRSGQAPTTLPTVAS
jgi:hypothetical protein